MLQNPCDHSLYTLIKDTESVAILIYVDDILVTGNSVTLIDQVKKFLHTQFNIKDLGPMKYFLGLEISRSSHGIYLHQRKYCLDIITDTGLLASKPSTIPMEQNHNLQNSTSSELSSKHISIYRRLVGRLIYLTISRPELSYPVHILAQFIAKPKHDHLQAAYRVVRYLKNAPGQGILFPATNSLTLRAFSDADWGGCKLTRSSLTGYCVTLGSTLISWKCKKQLFVSRSSSEAEYRALADTICEIVWLIALLKSSNHAPSLPISFYCGNKSALYLASNPVFHERTKHIEIDCHFI